MAVIINPVFLHAINTAHGVQKEIECLMEIQNKLLTPITVDAINLNSVEYIEELIKIFPNSFERMELRTHLNKIKV